MVYTSGRRSAQWTRDQLSRGKHLALQLKRWLAQPTPFDTTTDPRSINPVQPLASIGNLRENQLALLVVVYVTTVNGPGISTQERRQQVAV